MACGARTCAGPKASTSRSIRVRHPQHAKHPLARVLGQRRAKAAPKVPKVTFTDCGAGQPKGLSTVARGHTRLFGPSCGCRARGEPGVPQGLWVQPGVGRGLPRPARRQLAGLPRRRVDEGPAQTPAVASRAATTAGRGDPEQSLTGRPSAGMPARGLWRRAPRWAPRVRKLARLYPGHCAGPAWYSGSTRGGPRYLTSAPAIPK